MTNLSPTFKAALEAVRNADVVELKVVNSMGIMSYQTFPRVFNWLDLAAFIEKHDAKEISPVREI